MQYFCSNKCITVHIYINSSIYKENESLKLHNLMMIWTIFFRSVFFQNRIMFFNCVYFYAFILEFIMFRCTMWTDFSFCSHVKLMKLVKVQVVTSQLGRLHQCLIWFYYKLSIHYIVLTNKTAVQCFLPCASKLQKHWIKNFTESLLRCHTNCKF